LLTMLGRRASLPVAVCCSSRDSLDAVWSTVSASQEFSLCVLHSDQAQSERIAALDNFRQVVADWTHGSCEGNALPSGSNCVDDRQQQQSGLLMTTDACLPSAALGEAPLGARVLIHYDLPAKKVNYFFCSTWFILRCIMLNVSDGSWLSRIWEFVPHICLACVQERNA
jgi:translation initiation factor 4A